MCERECVFIGGVDRGCVGVYERECAMAGVILPAIPRAVWRSR